MGYPRSHQVDPLVSGIYHCISRCVRGQSLIERPDRCEWVVRRLERLTRTFAIDVCDFAVMRNHVHILLRTHPDLASAWTDEEVARRWLARPGGPPLVDFDERVRLSVRDPGRIAEWRSRLSDLGWFHKLWKERCSRMWNREEDQSGHLWQGRFRSIGCRDEASVLMQAAYILLNPVHCGAETELGDSPRTSMGRRITALSEAIAAGRFRQGVETYRRALLDPAMPCDPGTDVRSLSDADWTDRVAKRTHERAMREAIHEVGRSRTDHVASRGWRQPFMANVPSADRHDVRAANQSLETMIRQTAGGSEAGSRPLQHGTGDVAIRRDPMAVASRSVAARPRTLAFRHHNPWRGRNVLAMAASCSLFTFLDWIDGKGRIPRPDKVGWIDCSRPRLVDRLVGGARRWRSASGGMGRTSVPARQPARRSDRVSTCSRSRDATHRPSNGVSGDEPGT